MRRILIASATGVVMIGALFVPLPRMERKEPVTVPIQKSATIVLSQRITQPSIERKQESTTPEREEEVVIFTPEFPTQVLAEQAIIQSQPSLAAQTSEQSVDIGSYLSNPIEEEDSVAMKIYHEIEGTIEPPVFDLKLLSSLLVYPPAAKRQNKEGVVRVRLYISEQGIIERIVVEEDPGYGLAEATIKAFGQINPRPAVKDNVPIAVTMVFPVRWALQ